MQSLATAQIWTHNSVTQNKSNHRTDSEIPTGSNGDNVRPQRNLEWPPGDIRSNPNGQANRAQNLSL